MIYMKWIFFSFFVMHCLIPRKGSASKDEHKHIPFSYSARQIESFKNISNIYSHLAKKRNYQWCSSGFHCGTFAVYLLNKWSGKGSKQGHSLLLVQTSFKKVYPRLWWKEQQKHLTKLSYWGEKQATKATTITTTTKEISSW